MFGKNEVTKQFLRDDGSLLVKNVFYTIQGEGPQAGWPAIFVRLAKCNLRCFFCDTDFDSGGDWTLDTLTESIGTLASEKNCKLVVMTGGEPLLQNVVPLIQNLNRDGISVSIETAGTVWVPGLDRFFSPGSNIGWSVESRNLLVCSPKTPEIDPRIRAIVGAFKYILRAGEADKDDGLPSMSTQRHDQYMKLFRQNPEALRQVPVYLQAMDEKNIAANERNQNAVTAMCMQYGYRQSIQMHKIIGVE